MLNLAELIGEGKGNEKTRERDGLVGGGKERESNDRDILIEGAIVEFGRNLVQGKFPGIHKMTHTKTPSNTGEGAWTGLLL